MPARRRARFRSRQLNPKTVLLAFAVASGWFGFLYVLEPHGQGLISDDPDARRLLLNALGRASVTLISTVFACLFLAIPLTANIYTPQLIDIFVSSRTNQVVLGLYVFSAGTAMWISRTPPGDVSDGRLLVSYGLVMVTLVMILPYLFSVFRFLQPRKIINRVGANLVSAMRPHAIGTLRGNQERLTERIHHLGNIALKALERSDRDVALAAVETLDTCALDYLHHAKDRHPDSWFSVDSDQFPGFSSAAMRLVNEERTWVEMELLQQLGRAYGAALARVPDVISAISLALRHFATAAAEKNDRGVVDLTLRYFNNFLREAVKRGDLHAVYDLLFQARGLGRCLWPIHPHAVIAMGGNLHYYGARAAEAGMPFAHDLVAYDFGAIVTEAGPDHESYNDLVDAFLSIRAADGTLTSGMFKARVITAASLAERGVAGAAARIEETLRDHARHVPDARHCLLGNSEEFFWEVTDRMQNLNWLEPAVRERAAEILGRLESS